MAVAIKVENLSKAYQLGEIGTGTISRDLERWFAKIRGKEDPFLKIGETNDRSNKGTSDVVWSLKDINCEIQQGDAVGIIGRNGAGKSTLLKLLSRVTSPTTGSIKVKGRIASLLEVGTGFHPELTGKENIYLNGAILGMRKKEIKNKFDEIVDFAGVERYIDTPVKRYSSGMYVRLAFAVAAHLDSEILIVDEVLAVGDAEFQKKCLGKMNEVSKGEGRTVLFVSHNMSSVMELCNKGILLKNGNIVGSESSDKIIEMYMNQSKTSKSSWVRNDTFNSDAFFTKVWLSDNETNEIDIVNNYYDTYLNIEVDIVNVDITNTLAFEVKSLAGTSVYCSHDYDINNQIYKQGKSVYKIKLPNILKPGLYEINLGINSKGFTALDFVESAIIFEVIGSTSEAKPLQDSRPGQLYLPLKWQL